MSTRIQAHWLAVKEWTEELRAEFGDGPVYLASKSDRRVMPCDVEAAARALAGGTQRLASQAEIDGWKVADAKRKRFQEALDAARKTDLIVQLNPTKETKNHAD